MTTEMPSAAVRASGFTHDMRTHGFRETGRLQQVRWQRLSCGPIAVVCVCVCV